MAIRAAGTSFKLASATYVFTEIATWLTGISSDADQDEITYTTFSPGSSLPLKGTLYGATARTSTLTGMWSPTAEQFFNALSGAQNVAYEDSPEGTAVGKLRIYGSCNIGAWSGPQREASGAITFSISISYNSRNVETIASPPATVAITSSAVGDPSVLTTAAHGITVGATDVVTIAGHSGSTPSINGTFEATALSSTTLSIPVNVTVGGTGGTLQK